jgi:NDP-4-keto-2,6-dideoxyhexose 3-C-methyltransferase
MSNRSPATISSCRVCGNSHFFPVVNLGNQRLSGVFPIRDSAHPEFSPLEVIKCDNEENTDACGLVQLKHTAKLTSMYGEAYGYRSSISPTMCAHLNDIADFLIDYVPLTSGDIVLDIGCNDGTLLQYFKKTDARRIGVDPSSEQFRSVIDKDIELVFDYFSANAIGPIIQNNTCAVITAIAMFYDLQDPIIFMNDVKSILSKEGVLALEFSYMPLMLKNLTYDQICHEHLTYFSLSQIYWIAETVGLKILHASFNLINGGSIFVCLSRKESSRMPDLQKIEPILQSEQRYNTHSPFEQFERRVFSHRDDIRFLLEILKNSQKTVFGYGASTKGNIVLNFCGLDTDYLTAIFDASQEKHRRVTPGSNIPIISKMELQKIQPDYLFVLIWHLQKEVLVDEKDFFLSDGKGIFTLPRMHFVDRNNYHRLLGGELGDYGFSA